MLFYSEKKILTSFKGNGGDFKVKKISLEHIILYDDLVKMQKFFFKEHCFIFIF